MISFCLNQHSNRVHTLRLACCLFYATGFTFSLCLHLFLSLLAIIYFKKGVGGGRGFVCSFIILLIVFSCWCFSMKLCFTVFSGIWYLDLETESASGTICSLRLPNGWWYGLSLGRMSYLVVPLRDVSGCWKSLQSIRDCKMVMS